MRKGAIPQKKGTAFKLKWGYILAWVGMGFSAVFTVVYILAFMTGAYIRL